MLFIKEECSVIEILLYQKIVTHLITFLSIFVIDNGNERTSIPFNIKGKTVDSNGFHRSTKRTPICCFSLLNIFSTMRRLQPIYEYSVVSTPIILQFCDNFHALVSKDSCISSFRSPIKVFVWSLRSGGKCYLRSSEYISSRTSCLFNSILWFRHPWQKFWIVLLSGVRNRHLLRKFTMVKWYET